MIQGNSKPRVNISPELKETTGSRDNVRRRGIRTSHDCLRGKKKRKCAYPEEFPWSWRQADLKRLGLERFQYVIGVTGVINFRNRMPMNGSTRMLRARRKDINIKPNRRLDRKSSRGMLYENEELRMRTITINAEVEQGQHALKKLRRENEQLRREMWSLRDEYDKMEKQLRKKDTEDEDSDQENSYSDENYSQDEEETEEEEGDNQLGDKNQQKEENPDLENEENFQEERLQKSSKFDNITGGRAFDGLSVIDEQTEENTQTTEAGYGNASRGSSGNRNYQGMRAYEEACAANYETYDPYYNSLRNSQRKKGICYYDEGYLAVGPGYPPWNPDRPSSPYPYGKSVQPPSYEKQMQILQEQPLITQMPDTVDENGWVFPNQSAGCVYDPDNTGPIAIQIPGHSEVVFQERTGPDVFVSGLYPHDAYVVPGPPLPPIDMEEIQEQVFGAPSTDTGATVTEVEEEIGNLEIRDRGERPDDISSTQAEHSVDNNEQTTTTVAPSVRCGVATEEFPDVSEKISFFEMPRSDKFQSRLMVTLKTPASRTDRKSPKPSATLRSAGRQETPPHNQRFQTLPNQRVQPVVNGKGNVGPSPATNSRGPVAATLHRNPSTSSSSGSGSRQGAPEGHSAAANHIPAVHSALQSESAQRTEPQGVANAGPHVGSATGAPQPGGKPGKLPPPAPPPRTTSCPAALPPSVAATAPQPPPVVLTSPVGVTALHRRAFLRGKSPSVPYDTDDRTQEPTAADSPIQNPLLMSEPLATSSPTLRSKHPHPQTNPTGESPRLRKQSSIRATHNEDSSDDVSSRKPRISRSSAKTSDSPIPVASKSSPSFSNFRRPRKESQISVSSVDNVSTIPSANTGLDRRTSRVGSALNNVSISSSSGLDSPTKSDRRKRRVSIKFNKKNSSEEERQVEEDKRVSLTGILSKGSIRSRNGRKFEEADGTTSDRERTNSVSSRTSSGALSSGRRKFSGSSNRTILADEKIPWCGCWGNGCV